MNKLSKEKRKQLVLVGLVVTGVLVGLIWGVLGPQNAKRNNLKLDKADAEHRLQRIKQTIENAEQIEAQLADANKRLARIEETMATGDLYAWAINTLRQFKLGYRVEIPQFSQIDGPRDVPVFAGFPYKQANMTISGTAYYGDLGHFIADFENQFPYMRFQNLTLEPSVGQSGGEREKLSFRVELAALVKPFGS
jgi:Tfp pilus assembly protein PilO